MNKEKQTHILLIDDDWELTTVLTLRLETAGYRVTAANSGQEALEKIKKDPPDVVISDVLMPDIDGFSLLKQIKALQLKEELETPSGNKDIPIIVMSGRATETGDIFRLEGAVDFITKPVDSKLLINKIKELTEEKREGNKNDG